MPPAGIDMSLIREALARRAQGGLAGGGVPPAVAQQAQPAGATPTGGPNVPGAPPAAAPTPTQAQIPGQTRQLPASSATPPQQAAKAAGAATGFPDLETRDMAKTLLAKLVQFL